MKLKTYQRHVIDQIKSGSTVLDLGCGSGELLKLLIQKKQVTGYGIEISMEKIQTCVDHGISVLQGDIYDYVKEFKTHAFDTVILSQTLQEVPNPRMILMESLRIARQVIVTFPNFGYWLVRLQIAMGRHPHTSVISDNWLDSPNIRVITIQEFQNFCKAEGIRIKKEIALNPTAWVLPLAKLVPNLLSISGIFVLEKEIPENA